MSEYQYVPNCCGCAEGVCSGEASVDRCHFRWAEKRSDKRVSYDIDTLKGHVGYYESMARQEKPVNAFGVAQILRDLLTELDNP